MFEGFSDKTGKFMWELRFHNERPWFLAHKDEYERYLRAPFQALAEETHAEMARRFPATELQLHVARIYRDARRLHGRGPYKEHLWFSLKGDQKLLDGPMFWFEIGASDYAWGMGYYDAKAAQMAAYRAYIDAHPARVERLARGILEQDVFTLEGEEYSRPKGEKGPLLNPWYNKKVLGLTCHRDFGGDVLKAELPRILADGYAFLMPYYEFFCLFHTASPEE